MEAFEEKLRHHFRDRALLKTALTHSSFANESRAAGARATSGWSFWATLCWEWWWRMRSTGAFPTCLKGG